MMSPGGNQGYPTFPNPTSEQSYHIHQQQAAAHNAMMNRGFTSNHVGMSRNPLIAGTQPITTNGGKQKSGRKSKKSTAASASTIPTMNQINSNNNETMSKNFYLVFVKKFKVFRRDFNYQTL